MQRILTFVIVNGDKKLNSFLYLQLKSLIRFSESLFRTLRNMLQPGYRADNHGAHSIGMLLWQEKDSAGPPQSSMIQRAGQQPAWLSLFISRVP